MVKTYDSKCFDLAKYFLIDSPTLDTDENARSLALEIQGAIEAWLQWEEGNRP